MTSKFDIDFLNTATETLRSIAHPIRIAIIDLLNEKKELTVTEIYEVLHIEQAIASHHLRILKDKGVVGVNRIGKNSFYTLKNEHFATIIHAIDSILK
jgi:DNA-binding transcriptional ArsR family regulator